LSENQNSFILEGGKEQIDRRRKRIDSLPDKLNEKTVRNHYMNASFHDYNEKKLMYREG